jgi:3-isopropylmalate/(R)-2-methylmalate dehydratase small subunit
MQPFTRIEALVVPIDRPNVDTDAIIPKQFLKSIKRSGFGPNLFDEWRYLDVGQPDADNSGRPLNPDFVLNQPRYAGAEILLARENFGCGSSREHAPWALADFGIRAVIAPSYADIFFSNCCKNGLLPVVLPEAVVDALFQAVEATPGYRLQVDLEACEVRTPEGSVHPFSFNPALRERLLRGLDDIGVTLQSAEAIHAYEARRAREAPWLFAG